MPMDSPSRSFYRKPFHQEWSRDVYFIPGLPLLLALIAIGVQIDLKNPDDV